MLKFIVQVVLVLLSALTIYTLAVPVGTAKCGAGEVRFIANETQDNVTYKFVSVKDEYNTEACLTRNVTKGQFVLTVKPQDCNVTVGTDGMVNMQFWIAFHEMLYSPIDGFVNVTCNVTGPGNHIVNQTIANVTVERDVDTVNAKYPEFPPTKLMAKDSDMKEITAVQLGDEFNVCIDMEEVTRSPFKGAVVRECTLDGVAFTDKKGCTKKDLLYGMPGGGFTYSNGSSCTNILAFRGRGKTAKDTVKIVCIVEYTFLESTQDGATCVTNITRRRRSIKDHVARRLELILGFNEGQQEVPRKLETVKDSVNGAPSGYTSNTVFYIVVAIMASVVMVAMGVAVFFGARARRVLVTTAGKDNLTF